MEKEIEWMAFQIIVKHYHSGEPGDFFKGIPRQFKAAAAELAALFEREHGRVLWDTEAQIKIADDGMIYIRLWDLLGIAPIDIPLSTDRVKDLVKDGQAVRLVVYGEKRPEIEKAKESVE